MRLLTIMVGIQGAGKSTLAREMKDRDTVIIEPDMFRQVITGQPFYKEAEDIVWSHVKTAARVFLRDNQSIIIDATGIRRNSRSMWVSMGREFPGTQIDACLVLTPLGEALERNSLRSMPVPTEAVEKYARQLETPVIGEGFDNIHILNRDFQIIGSAKKSGQVQLGVYEKLVGMEKPYKFPEVIIEMQEEVEVL